MKYPQLLLPVTSSLHNLTSPDMLGSIRNSQDGECKISPSEDSTSVDEENSAVQFDDPSCQTDLEFPELSVLQQKSTLN